MIKSMTGYGKGRKTTDHLALTVEIKSVNHRYSDLTVKSPRGLLPFENSIKKTIGRRLNRGKIDVFINQESAAGSLAVPAFNRGLAASYMKVFKEMRDTFDLEGGIPLSLLAEQKEVILLKEEELPEDEVRLCLDEALKQAMEAIEGMRGAEGEALQEDMENRLAVVEELLGRIEQRAPQVPEEWQEKLSERLTRLHKDVEFDPQRVAQEIAVFADRCDISEEVVRFRSHLKQFRLLFETDEPIGRQMDFLVQELNREVNTMGSKSNDAELTRTVVTIKSELEKIREQVQNVE